MSRDIKNLEVLYEKMESNTTDFLQIENGKILENFNWNKFWDGYIFCYQNFYPLYEKFEITEVTDTTDKYKVTATNGEEYELYVNFLPANELDNLIINSYMSNPKNKEEIKQLQNAISNTSNPILNINFRDSNKSISLTGKMGNYSYSVIGGIKKAIIESLHKRNETIPDVIFFYIKKDEPKKLEFFKNTFGRYVFPQLKHQYIDESDSMYNLVYFYI